MTKSVSKTVNSKRKPKLASQSNSLIISQYKLDPLEMKVVLAYISKITKFDKDFKPIAIGFRELATLLNVDSSNIHKTAKKIQNSLPKKTLKITNPDDPNDVTVTSWTSSINLNIGVMTIRIDPSLKPHLLNLKNTKGFTQSDIEITNKLKSTYTIRLYMFLKSFLNTKHKTRSIPYQDLRDMLAIEPGSYKRFQDFKVRILQPAIKDLKRKVNGSHISNFTFEYKSSGRPVQEIEFKIIPQQYQELITFNESQDQLPVILGLDTGVSINNKLKEIGFDTEEIENIYADYDLQDVRNALSVYMQRSAKGLVVNEPPSKTPQKYYFGLLKKKVQLSKSEIGEIVKIETERLQYLVKKAKQDAYNQSLQDYALSLSDQEVQEFRNEVIANEQYEAKKSQYQFADITDPIFNNHFAEKITEEMVKANLYQLLGDQGVDIENLPKEIDLDIKL